MQYYQTDHSSGARLIGGEMLDWSDLGAVGDLGVVPTCLTGVLRDSPGPVLLVGPRAAMLLEGLPEQTRVDVVVRGLPDARELSAMASLRSRATVWCGGMERLEPRDGYDVVIVLDGPERVLTPDSPGLTAEGFIDLLATHLAPDGVLAAAVANGMSVADWLELPLEPRDVVARSIRSMALTLDDVDSDDMEESDDDDADDAGPSRDRFVHDNANDRWWSGASGFADRAPFVSELGSVFGRAGLAVDRAWASYPHPDHPSVMVDIDNLDGAGPVDRDRRDRWDALARSQAVAAETDLFASKPALTDPARAVDQIFAAGLGVAMAPGWLVVASRDGTTVAGPAMAWSDRGKHPYWGSVWSAQPVADPKSDDDPSPGHDAIDDGVVFVPAAPRVAVEGPLERVVRPQRRPTGPSLESEFRAALESGNHQRIRRLLRTYFDWVRDEHAALGDSAMAASMDNVTVTDRGLTLTDRTWRWHGRAEPEVIVARGVRRAVMRLLRAGLAHPWRTDIAPDELTVTLMIMIGAEDPVQVVLRAAEVDASWESLLAQVSAGDRDEFVATQLDAGRSQFTAMPAPSPGYRETVVRSSRMATELEVRQGQVEWLEAALRMRESRMASVERNIDDIRNSMSFKFGRAVTAPGRRVALSARRGVLRMVPRDLMDKAERAARRLLK